MRSRHALAWLGAGLLGAPCGCTLLFDVNGLDTGGADASAGGSAGSASAGSVTQADEGGTASAGITSGSSAGSSAGASSGTTGGAAGAASAGTSTGNSSGGATTGDGSVAGTSGGSATTGSASGQSDDAGTHPEAGGGTMDAAKDAQGGGMTDAHDAARESAPVFDASGCASYVLAPNGTPAASTSRGTNVVGNAIDKNLGTRWESEQQLDVPGGGALPPQWVAVDFLAPVYVTSIEVLWEGACAQSYEIDVSNDGAKWTQIANVLGNLSGSNVAPTDWSLAVTTQATGVGRYVRVYMTALCHPPYGYSIWEMRVYGHGVTSCDAGL